MRADEHGAGSRATIETLTRLDQVEELGPAWDHLVGATPCNRAFSCSAWYIAACRAERRRTSRLIVARRGAELVALLPLVEREDGRTLGFASDFSDYNDAVARPEDTAVVARLLEVARSAGVGDLVLRGVREDSNLARAAKLLNSEHDEICSVRRQEYPFIQLTSGRDEYLATRSPKFRKLLRGSLRKAEEARLSIGILDSRSLPPALLPALFLPLHIARFGEASAFAGGEGEALAREVLPRLHAEGRITVVALLRDGLPAGIDLYLHGPESLCAWNGAFLPDLARFSPGHLMISGAVGAAFDRGHKECDLLHGNEAYKLRWANASRTIDRLVMAAL